MELNLNGATFVIVPVLCASGLLLVLGRRARARLLQRTHPVGRLVNVRGRRMHIDARGAGWPTVVLETGLGGPGLVWTSVQEQVSRFARVCSYDRSGLGWSDAGPTPRTASVIAHELRELLEAAGEEGPYLLVGHSSGAHSIRLFADLYPQDVAGLIFVDGAHEDQFERYPSQASPVLLWVMRQLPRFVATGIPALVPGLIPTGLAGPLPGEAQATFRALLAGDPKAAQAMVDEMAGVPASLGQVRAARGRFPAGIPVTVLSHGEFRAMLGVQMTEEQVREGERVWLEMQNELAGLSQHGRLAVVEGAGHELPFTHPEAVAEAIWGMIASLRNEWGLHPGQQVEADPLAAGEANSAAG